MNQKAHPLKEFWIASKSPSHAHPLPHTSWKLVRISLLKAC